jgi:hypothetical protein
MAWSDSLFSGSSGGSGMNNFMNTGGMAGISGILQGLFGNSGAGYEEAANQMQKNLQQGANYLAPYRNAGEQAIPQLQQWMQQFQNPQEFLSNVFSKYETSPFAKNQMAQAQRGANNAASAGGLLGSTAHMREAGNIANQVTSQDMQQYLNNFLGVGNNYGQGLNSLFQGGLSAANSTAGLFGQNARGLGELYGGAANGKESDSNDMMAGFMKVLPYLFM